MRFLVDMPLSPALAHWLEERGHEAVHAQQLGLDRAQDEIILERARSENRVIVTADLDYPRLLALTHSSGPGLVLFRGGTYSEEDVIRRMTRVFASVQAEELPRSVVVVDNFRIRRRALPLGSSE